MTSELRPCCPNCLSHRVSIMVHGERTYQMQCRDCLCLSPEVEIRPVMIEATRKAWVMTEWRKSDRKLEQEG